MPTYTILYAEDVPCYGQFEIEADGPDQALALAREYDHDCVILEDLEWNNSVCKRIVHIEDQDGAIVAEEVALDDTFLRFGGEADRLCCEAAHDLLNALKAAHRDVLDFARERDPDQLGTWDAIFTPAKHAIAKAEGRAAGH